MTNHKMIEEIIMSYPQYQVFVLSDFVDSINYDNIRQIISRLENTQKIRRILPGVYDRPMYSKILNDYSEPNPNEVAKALARKNSWTIAPSGDAALNLLGLSTQVPAQWNYISSGPSCGYKVGNTIINFTHRADKELIGMSKKTALVIQALKALGDDNITSKEINKISLRLTSTEKEAMLFEARQTTGWIYRWIKEICK